jgi:hypothetical protein
MIQNDEAPMNPPSFQRRSRRQSRRLEWKAQHEPNETQRQRSYETTTWMDANGKTVHWSQSFRQKRNINAMRSEQTFWQQSLLYNQQTHDSINSQEKHLPRRVLT